MGGWMREAPRARGPRLHLLLATSSVAALLVGGGVPAALAGSCAIQPVTNQSSVSDSASINCINISGVTVTGNVTNTGTGVITATGGAAPTRTGILVAGGSIGGTISNAGTINAANYGIQAQGNAAISGGIANSGTISAFASAVVVQNTSSFAGGIVNSGTITALNATGIFIANVSSFAGGISNSGTISGRTSGIEVYIVSTFAGGISNSGTISAALFSSIWITGVSSFAGGISNSGTISSAGFGGIQALSVSNFAGGISNSGTISAGNYGIVVNGVSSFAGGISNSGTISAAGRTGIVVNGVSSFAGGISNSGTLSASNATGIFIANVSSFAGGINNSGTVTAGANGIVVNDSTFAGGISNSGTVSGVDYGIFVYSTSIFAGGISNSGTISAGGNSGIWVVAVSSFAGGITNSGTISSAGSAGLSVSSVSGFAGDIGNSGTISSGGYGISVSSVSTFAGNIANSGTISSAGSVGIKVSSVSTFAGGIANSGTISSGNKGLSVSGVSTFAGSISNSGAISSGGTGIYVNGVSSFAGGITNTGTISGVSGIVVSGSGPVSVFDSGVIVGTGGTAVNLSGNAAGNTFTLGPGYGITGKVLGAGSDTFQLGGSGSGAFNLGTVGTQYSGFTTFNVVSGSWTATGAFGQTQAWNVNGGTLAGTGTFAAINVNSGGTLQPGTPGTPGTAMTITGNLAFASGALYLVQLNSTTASLARVGGTATLTGGTVNVQFAPGSEVSQRYTILTATGGLGGTSFAGLTTTNLPVGVSDSLSYDAHDVYLNLTAAFSNYIGLSANQQAVANTLTSYFNSTGLPAAFFRLSRNGLTQIDGEAATGGERGAFQLMTGFLALMLDPTAGGGGAKGGSAPGFAEEPQRLPPDVAQAYASVLKAPAAASFDQRWRAWGAGFGGSSQTNGNSAVGSSNVTASVYGYAAGMDYRVAPDTLLGFALAGGGTSWSLAQGLGNGRSDAFQAGLYGKSYFGPAYVSGALAFANHWFTTNRIALGDQLTANFTGQSYAARGEAGYRYGLPITGVIAGITPYAALQVQGFHTPGSSETNLSGGGFGLNYAATNATDTRSELGARFDNLQIVAGMPLVLRGRLAWAHDWVGNPSLGAVFESLPGASFVVSGASIPKNSALTSAGAELKINANWSLAAKFDGEFASGSQTYAGTGTLRYTW